MAFGAGCAPEGVSVLAYRVIGAGTGGSGAGVGFIEGGVVMDGGGIGAAGTGGESIGAGDAMGGGGGAGSVSCVTSSRMVPPPCTEPEELPSPRAIRSQIVRSS